MESYELASQLAQFSTVEQLSKVNSNLELTQALLTSVNNAQMVDMLGKQVTGFYDSMQVKDGAATNGQFELDGAAASVTVNILDESGTPVRTITLGATEAGRHDIGWDGKDADGATVPDGTYTFEVEATDADGESIGVTQTVSGKVFAFVIDNGTPYLILDSADGLRLPINTVMEVQESIAA
jgi:flagellar basal-body rod modification protein FlgD